MTTSSVRRWICSPWLALFCALCIFAVDASSKFLTQLYLLPRYYSSSIYPYGGIPIFKDVLGVEFSFVHETNRGAAWGMFKEYQVPLLVLRMFMVAGLAVYLFLSKKHPERRLPIAFIIAGATGNIVDYFLYGHVVDMFHFVLWGYDYPVFNVADSAIFIGISWLFLGSFFSKTSKEIS